MAISREHKEDLVSDYTTLLANSSGLVVTEYRGLKMDTFHSVRASLRDVGASYIVTRNRLLKLALEQSGMPAADKLLTGPVAVGFAGSDLTAMLKILLDKSKEAEPLILKGAIIGDSVYSQSDLKTLSELPTLDELRAQLLGMLVQPAQGLLGVLAAPARDLVSVLDAGSNSLVNVLAAYAAKEDAA